VLLVVLLYYSTGCHGIKAAIFFVPTEMVLYGYGAVSYVRAVGYPIIPVPARLTFSTPAVGNLNLPCTAYNTAVLVLVRGAHNCNIQVLYVTCCMSELLYTVLLHYTVRGTHIIRGYIRALQLQLRSRGEGGNWAHERKSGNLINEHAFRKITTAL
jgi:hypothetical protein